MCVWGGAPKKEAAAWHAGEAHALQLSWPCLGEDALAVSTRARAKVERDVAAPGQAIQSPLSSGQSGEKNQALSLGW